MKKQQIIVFLLLVFSAMLSFSCASQVILNDKNPTPEPVGDSSSAVPVDDFLQRLASVQTGNFEFVYAFRRKDNEIFTSEDKKYLKENSPYDTNQWVLTADEKTVIAGSNYVFTPKNLEALKKRFKVEEYSPEKEVEANTNSSTNVNSNVNN